MRTETTHLVEELTPAACLAYLTRVPVGRFVFVQAGKPLMLPVNHVVDGESLVFATAPGSKLRAASHDDAVVTYQADDIEPDGTGWSVVVQGRPEVVTDLAEAARLDAMGLGAWADAVPRRRWIRILPTSVTGTHRRLA